MKTKTYEAKRQFVQKEKGLEKKHSKIFIGLAIFACAYYYFFQPKTIGNDIRYNIFIFWLPTLIGTLTIGIYRRKFLLSKFSTNKGFTLWTFMTVFYLLQGFISSYLSFGQVAKISWDIVSWQNANENQTESLVCKVARFRSERQYAIEFEFDGKHERIYVDYQTLKPYVDESPKEYEITIEAQKGLWNYYFVNNWTLRKE
ncbi:MAG: hypothetical protein EOP48_14335 [Sphingobacteriales bacterium]|nr:MAG: hypothetical protein EOP48_14335 [Sphingobacteriales bacterium]